MFVLTRNLLSHVSYPYLSHLKVDFGLQFLRHALSMVEWCTGGFQLQKKNKKKNLYKLYKGFSHKQAFFPGTQIFAFCHMHAANVPHFV